MADKLPRERIYPSLEEVRFPSRSGSQAYNHGRPSPRIGEAGETLRLTESRTQAYDHDRPSPEIGEAGETMRLTESRSEAYDHVRLSPENDEALATQKPTDVSGNHKPLVYPSQLGPTEYRCKGGDSGSESDHSFEIIKDTYDVSSDENVTDAQPNHSVAKENQKPIISPSKLIGAMGDSKRNQDNHANGVAPGVKSSPPSDSLAQTQRQEEDQPEAVTALEVVKENQKPMISPSKLAGATGDMKCNQGNHENAVHQPEDINPLQKVVNENQKPIISPSKLAGAMGDLKYNQDNHENGVDPLRKDEMCRDHKEPVKSQNDAKDYVNRVEASHNSPKELQKGTGNHNISKKSDARNNLLHCESEQAEGFDSQTIHGTPKSESKDELSPASTLQSRDNVLVSNRPGVAVRLTQDKDTIMDADQMTADKVKKGILRRTNQKKKGNHTVTSSHEEGTDGTESPLYQPDTPGEKKLGLGDGNMNSVEDLLKDQVVLHAQVVIRFEAWAVLQKNRTLGKFLPVETAIEPLRMYKGKDDYIGYKITGSWKDVDATTSLVAEAVRVNNLENLIGQEKISKTSKGFYASKLGYDQMNDRQHAVPRMDNERKDKRMETHQYTSDQNEGDSDPSNRSAAAAAEENADLNNSRVTGNKFSNSSGCAVIGSNPEENCKFKDEVLSNENGGSKLHNTSMTTPPTTKLIHSTGFDIDDRQHIAESNNQNVIDEPRRLTMPTENKTGIVSTAAGSQMKKKDRRRNRTFHSVKEQETASAVADDRSYFITDSGLVLQAYKGSFLDIKDVDCIVISTNSTLSPGGGVAAVVKNRAGPGFAKMCKNKSLEEGECISTGGGNLPYKRVLHVLVPSWNQGERDHCIRKLEMAIKSALDTANNGEMRSMALSGIGTGNQKFPKDKWVEIVVKILQKYNEVRKAGRHCLEEIRFVDNNTELIDLLKVGLFEAFPGVRDNSYSRQQFREAPLQGTHNIDAPNKSLLGLNHSQPEATQVPSFPDRGPTNPTESGRMLERVGGFMVSPNCTVVLSNTSITMFKGDAIVVADTEYTSAPVPEQVVFATGKEYQTERDGMRLRDIGEVFVTKAGDLPCKFVLRVKISNTTGHYTGMKELATAVKAILMETVSMKLETIAFPTIFKGFSAINENDGCKVLLEEICGFLHDNPKCLLREIHLLDADANKLQQYVAFLWKYDKTQTTESNSSNRRGYDAARNGDDETLETKRPGASELPATFPITLTCQVVLINGNITNFSGDAIAISDTKYLTGLGIEANAVSAAAGTNYAGEKYKRAEANPGQIVVTSAGQLRVRVVLHAMCVNLEACMKTEQLEDLVTSILKAATTGGFKAIAISALWKDFRGITTEQGCGIMVEQICNFVQKRPDSSLREISLFDTDMDIIGCYGEMFNVRMPDCKAGIKGINPSQRDTQSESTQPEEREGAHSRRKRRERLANDAEVNSSICFVCKREDEPLQQQCGHYACSGCAVSNMGCKTCRDKFHEARTAKSRGEIPQTRKNEEKDNECAICLSHINNCQTLACSHAFCRRCIETWFRRSKVCPVCKAVCGTVTGNQPRGTMTHREIHATCSGYEKYGTIEIKYKFNDGMQEEGHPNPGMWYHGATRTAYLPNNREGRKILRLLRQAFDQRLIFTVGRSVTTGKDNVVTWNDIHHKSSMSGGPEKFGYPDPTYFSRVREELKAKGITDDGTAV